MIESFKMYSLSFIYRLMELSICCYIFMHLSILHLQYCRVFKRSHLSNKKTVAFEHILQLLHFHVRYRLTVVCIALVLFLGDATVVVYVSMCVWSVLFCRCDVGFFGVAIHHTVGGSSDVKWPDRGDT
jgi:hypothetical protein